MAEIILKTVDVCRDFKTGSETVHAVKNANIEVEKGQLVILRGRSGSGKTTLLNQLSALDMPTSGQVLFHGNDLTKMSEAKRDDYRRKSIGFAFQSLALLSFMTAYENIEFALRVAGYPAKDRKARAQECLTMVDLKKRMNHRPGEMSGGEQQRVAIARALAKNPKLLLCDEPTGALDYNTGKSILQLLQDTARKSGMTVIIITHNYALTSIGDRVIKVKNGRIESVEINDNPMDIRDVEW